jgi:large subunit ribosomal protein L15
LFRKKVTAINIGSLAERFEAGAEVNQTSLIAAGLINKLGYQIKILAQGELEIALNLKVHAISTTAKEKVEKAGGTVELIK